MNKLLTNYKTLCRVKCCVVCTYINEIIWEAKLTLIIN